MDVDIELHSCHIYISHIKDHISSDILPVSGMPLLCPEKTSVPDP